MAFLLSDVNQKLSNVNQKLSDVNQKLSDVSQYSEASVLELAESVFVEFSKAGEAVSHQQMLTDTEKCYRLQLEGRDQYDFPFELGHLEPENLESETPQHIAVFSQHTPEEFEMKLLDQSGCEYAPVAEHYFNPEHEHNDEVSSVSIELPGLFNISRINAWVEMFLQEKGEDIYRIKGVLGVQDEEHRIVYQGVHMLLGLQRGKNKHASCTKTAITFRFLMAVVF